jgi:ferrous iron transport protein B
MTVFAYVIAMIVYQIGGLITGEVSFNFFTIVAFAALVGLIYLLCRKGYKPEKETVHLSGKLDAASAE